MFRVAPKNKKESFYEGKEDTSIVLFFASILCRLAYEPPNYYQLFLLKILKLFSEKIIAPISLLPVKNQSKNLIIKGGKGYDKESPTSNKVLALEYLYNSLKQARDAQTQNAFVKVLKDSIIKDLNENRLAEEINKITESALNRETVKAAKGVREKGMQKIESYLTTEGFSDDDTQIFKQTDKETSEPPPLKIGKIKTIYLQSSDELNVYVTAFAELNSIFVTFRGSNSFKNIMTDLKFARSKKSAGSNSCTKQEEEEIQRAFTPRTSTMQNGGTEPTTKGNAPISFFRGVTSLLDTSIHTLTYTVIHLATWLKDNRGGEGEPTQVFTFGHSLGGGLATLYSYKYPKIYDSIKDKDEEGKVSKVSDLLKPNIIGISNAAPRILGKGAEAEFHKMMVEGRIKFIRQWTDGDIITALPMEGLGFLHPKQWKEGQFDMVKTVKHKNHMPGQGPLAPIFRGKGKKFALLGFPFSHSHQTKINFYPIIQRVTGALSTGTVKREIISRRDGDKQGIADQIDRLDILLKEKEKKAKKTNCDKEHIVLLRSKIKELKKPKGINILLAKMRSHDDASDKPFIVYTIHSLQKERYDNKNPFTGHKTDKSIKDYNTFLSKFINKMKQDSSTDAASAAGGRRKTTKRKKYKLRTTHKRHNKYIKRNTRKRHRIHKSLRKKTRKH